MILFVLWVFLELIYFYTINIQKVVIPIVIETFFFDSIKLIEYLVSVVIVVFSYCCFGLFARSKISFFITDITFSFHYIHELFSTRETIKFLTKANFEIKKSELESNPKQYPEQEYLPRSTVSVCLTVPKKYFFNADSAPKSSNQVTNS